MLIRFFVLNLSFLFCFSSMAFEAISLNIEGLWYRGRIPDRKIAYIDDINERLGSNYTIEEIQTDIALNGCTSIFIQESVEAMLRVFGPSRKIVIRQIDSNSTIIYNSSVSTCTYKSRGGRTGVVCYENICVGKNL